MTDLALIRQLPSNHERDDEMQCVTLRTDRLTLAKTRWRGVAEDGREFGFDLSAPLGHGACFFIEGATRYLVEQKPEAVLEVPVATLEEAAAIAWRIGNLHLGAQVLPTGLRMADDPAAVQMLTREHIAFQRRNEIFLPLTAGHHHHLAHE